MNIIVNCGILMIMFYNLLSQIIIAVVKCKTSASSNSLDSLDSYEKPPLLNRHLYQPPRRATFSKCIPESEVSCKEDGTMTSINVCVGY